MLEYYNNKLKIESCELQEIAVKYGTPCYVYSLQQLRSNYLAYANALQNHGHRQQIFYAIKANSNLTILRILQQLGAGFDCVSGGEITRALQAGSIPEKIMFSGVGKTHAEIKMAIELGIHSINIESAEELIRVHAIAKELNLTANIAFRVNPNITIDSHPYISTGSHNNKFGIEYSAAFELYKHATTLSNLNICGITCHIGSQITSLEPFMQALDQILQLTQQLTEYNINLSFIDIGGGLGINYHNETPPTIAAYVNAIISKLKHCKLTPHIEPGRSIVGNAGVLLTKVEYVKTTASNNFAVVDAAMNDLMRPVLYDSYHEIMPVIIKPNASKKYNIVGPVCESGDFLAHSRDLALAAGDLLILKDCGAYGSSMSSNYNTRPRSAEILVSGDKTYVIRDRETIAQLMQNEQNIDVRSILL
jgi:diaminopimelate decarboxylase